MATARPGPVPIFPVWLRAPVARSTPTLKIKPPSLPVLRAPPGAYAPSAPVVVVVLLVVHAVVAVVPHAAALVRAAVVVHAAVVVRAAALVHAAVVVRRAVAVVRAAVLRAAAVVHELILERDIDIVAAWCLLDEIVKASRLRY